MVLHSTHNVNIKRLQLNIHLRENRSHSEIIFIYVLNVKDVQMYHCRPGGVKSCK